jgi:subtilisin
VSRARDATSGVRPAWSLPASEAQRIERPPGLPPTITRDWAWKGSTGAGVRVCVLDSGVDHAHPQVGEVQSAVVVERDEAGELVVGADHAGDVCGHGTACASIVRSLAPECELHSVRVLGAGYAGSGPVLVEGLRHAVEQGFDVINISLSTTKREFAAALHEVCDRAYFRRSILVASAHNMPVDSWPWRFSSVVSVGSHEGRDPFELFYNPSPPVEFFARGVEVDVAWAGGGSLRTSGNSFATPHVSGLCALILARHPALTPFELKTVLYMTAANVRGVTDG